MADHDLLKKSRWSTDEAALDASHGKDDPSLFGGSDIGKRSISGSLVNPRVPVRESGLIQRHRARQAAAAAQDNAAEQIQHAASDAGSPLPGALRERFESSLGTDLSTVRVHTGSASAAAAEAVGAQAYTTGQDIHFAAGHYDPSSKSGQHLLAHEVAHTVQQGNSATTSAQAKLEVSQADDSHEQEADRAADAMLGGAPAAVSKGTDSASLVQRKPSGTQTGMIDMPDDYVGKARLDMPPDYVGKPGAQVLADFVKRAEKEIAALAKSIDKASSPEAVVAAACQRILDGFTEVEHALNHSPANGQQVHALMERLDAAIGKLFTLARQHRIAMRETGLEDVFDREDRLRVRNDISFGGRANRADQYYDADFGGAQRHSGPAPDASTIAEDVQDGNTGNTAGEPNNRDELIREIEGLEHRMWFALDQAFMLASAEINEPEMPKDPSLLDALAEAAAASLLAAANTALGGTLDAAAKSTKVIRVLAKARAGLREHVGKDTAKALMAGFAASAKSAIIPGAKIGIEHAMKQEPKAPSAEVQQEFNPGSLAVSPKQIYLLHAHQHTIAVKEGMSQAFGSYRSTLKRLPVETLRDLHAAFSNNVFNDVRDKFRDLLVLEWVNFVKRASEKGYQMRDAATRKRELGKEEPGLLAESMWPAGVVHIRVLLGPEGRVTFKDAVLPGVSSTVQKRIKMMNQPLSSLAMYRRIELVAPNEMTPAGGSFDVDHQGTIERINVHGAARGALAAVAHPVRAVVFDESDVAAGALALLQKLSMYTTSALKKLEA